MKNNQKCVRLSDKVVKYIDSYRGDNFSEKLENYILDTEERREQLVLDWNQLQAMVNDKRQELETVRSKIRKISQVDQRFQSLVMALLELVDS